MHLAYSPFHRPIQLQRTLQLHPWQAYPEPFSTPRGVFSLEHAVNHRCLGTHASTIIEVAKCQVPITPGWGEAVVKGRSAQLFHSVVGT